MFASGLGFLAYFYAAQHQNFLVSEFSATPRPFVMLVLQPILFDTTHTFWTTTDWWVGHPHFLYAHESRAMEGNYFTSCILLFLLLCGNVTYLNWKDRNWSHYIISPPLLPTPPHLLPLQICQHPPVPPAHSRYAMFVWTLKWVLTWIIHKKWESPWLLIGFRWSKGCW